MDRYEVMAGKMAPLTDGAHRKWGFAGKVETRSYERLVDALIDFVETGDGLKARFLTGFAACLAADRKSVENRGFGVAVRKVRCHRGEDGTVRVSSVETMHERRYTVDRNLSSNRAKRGTGCPRCNGKKTSQSKMKAVVCVETGKIYESIMSAGRDVERTNGAICQALRNESRTCAGYHWRYLDE